MFNRILTVCVGNICRSPTAEVLLRETLKSPPFHISSAGLGALVDKPIEKHAAAVLQQNGHFLPEHRARQLTREILRDVDLVLAMEKSHIEHIRNFAPEAHGKIFLLGKWQNECEIADPYRRDEAAFLAAYQQIADGVAAWAARINR